MYAHVIALPLIW